MHEMRLAISEAPNSERLSFQIRDGSPRASLEEQNEEPGKASDRRLIRYDSSRPGAEHRRWGSLSIVLLPQKVRSSRRGTLRNRLQMGNVKPTR